MSNRIVIEIGADGTAVIKETGKIVGSTEKMEKETGGLLEKAKKHWMGYSAAIYAVYKPLSELASLTSNYETALVDMGKVTEESLESINQKIMAMPAALGGSTELVEGYYQTISAGVTDPIKSIETLTVAAKAAKAAHIEQSEVIKGLTKVMAGFEGEIESVTEASDLLFQMEQEGQTSFKELIPVIGGLAKLSHDLGVSQDEMGASLATITQTAGSTSEAATQYNAILIALTKSTEVARIVQEEMGYSGVQAAIKELGLAGVLQALQDNTDGSVEAMSLLLGSQEAMIGVSALGAKGFETYNQKLASMADKAGKTDQAFKDWETTLAGLWDTLKNKVGKEAIKFGMVIAPAVKMALEGVGYMIGFVADNADALTVALTAAAIVQAPMLYAKIAVSIGSLVTAAAGLKTIGSLSIASLGPMGLAGVAAVAAVAGYKLGQAIDGWVYKLTKIDLSGLNSAKDIMEHLADLKVPDIVNDRQIKMLEDLGFKGAGAIERFKEAVKSGTVEKTAGGWVNLAQKAMTVVTDAGKSIEMSEAAVDALNGAMQSYLTVIENVGEAQLRFAGKGFTDELKAQEASIDGMKAARGEYLGIINEVYQKRSAMLDALIMDENEKKLRSSEMDKALAESRLGAWSQYYETLKGLHSSAVDAQKVKSQELLQLEEQIKNQRQGYADLKLSLEQKLMTASEKYYSTQKSLQEQFDIAMGLSGQKKIDALGEWSRAMADTANEVVEGDKVIIDQKTAVTDAISAIGRAQGEITIEQEAIKTARQDEIAQIGEWKEKLKVEMDFALTKMNEYRQSIKDLGMEITNLNTDVVLKVDNTQAMAAIEAVKFALESINMSTAGMAVGVSTSSGGRYSVPDATMPWDGPNADLGPAYTPPPKGAVGTNFVKRTGLAVVHFGEEITPAKFVESDRRVGQTTIKLSPTIQIIGSDKDGKQLARELDGELAALVRNARSQLARELG